MEVLNLTGLLSRAIHSLKIFESAQSSKEIKCGGYPSVNHIGHICKYVS